jgi:hypothetical protein
VGYSFFGLSLAFPFCLPCHGSVLYPAYWIEQCVETWRLWRLKKNRLLAKKRGWGCGGGNIRQNLFFEKTLRQMAKVHHKKMLLEPSIDIWQFVIIFFF